MIIIGKYIIGRGHAHCNNNNNRTKFFGCSMFGTFNVLIETKLDYSKLTPCISKLNTEYYLVKINNIYYAYLVRWEGSTQPFNKLELVSKRLLPDILKEGKLTIEILDKWTDEQRDNWAKDLYWWQTFDWSPKKRANSKELSDIINKEINWSDLEVLDIGSNYGYHSFNASKLGAFATGIEINDTARQKAQIINDHIEMQDCSFYKHDTYKEYDVILYLSVHHQIDSEYIQLVDAINHYKQRCRKYFVIELIMPPTFGKEFTSEQIDKIVGGKVLAEYHHNVRGIRKLYLIKKDNHE